MEKIPREIAVRFQRLPIPTLIAALISCGAAHAQSAPPDDSQALDRVTVTGSNLRRADTETPSPVQVITLDQIKQSGYTDISDVLHNLTSNGAGTLSQSFGGAFAAGASGIALRGLTVSATLVLIDGHRVAPNAQPDDAERLFTDVSSIPLEAIDRIEVLKDGASSIYGSDAIAGVVNIILKKSYVGNEVSAEYGVSKYMDGRLRHVTGTFGFGDLEADGHNAYVSLEYREQDPIYVRDRPYLSQTDFTSQGGNNATLGVPSSLNGGLAPSATGYFVDPKTLAITGFLPGCNATLYAAGKCTYIFSDNYLQIPTQNLNVLGSYTQNLPGGWQLALKASLFDTHSSTTQAPSPSNLPGASPVITAVVGPGVPLGVYPANGVGILATVPATYPGNKTGTTQILNVNFTQPVPNISEDSQNYRFSAELTGTLFGFDTSLSTGYSEDLIYKKATGLIDVTALSAELNNPVTPYRVGQAFGLNSAAQNAAVFPTDYSLATSKLAYVNAELSRDLFQLPGGALSVGAGLDYRHLELDSTAPNLIAEGLQINNNAYAIGSQNVSAVYGEVAAPVLKQLEVDASVRYDSYSGSFADTTPKIGFKLTPIEQVTFRGTYSKGFRAPNPAEEGQVGQGFLVGVIPDPILCPNPKNPNSPGNYPAACSTQPPLVQQAGVNLKPEKSTSYTGGFILEPVKNYSVSVDYYDIKIKDQIISGIEDPDFNIFSNEVRAAPSPMPYVNAAGVTVSQTPPVGEIAYLAVPYLNAAFTHTDGVDLDARGKIDLGTYGRVTIDLTESHVFQYQQQSGQSGETLELAGTHGPSSVSGDTGNPRDRAQFVVSYDRGPLTVTGTTNWTSSYSVLDPSQGQNTCAAAIGSSPGLFFSGVNPPSEYCRVKSFTTFDLYANYKVTKALSIHGSILNLFNQNAPFDFATYGAAGNSSGVPYNPAFAQSGAIGRFFTVGAQYRF